MNPTLIEPRRPARGAVVLLLATAMPAGLAVGLAPGAAAAPGPAPEPAHPTVVSKVHTDAVATFLDQGRLVLATVADTPQPGTRHDAEDVWFHVDDASATTLPTGFEFIGPAGTDVWIAPETHAPDQLWPGFSTSGVPAGAVDGDATELVLTGVVGPGDVEVYTGGGVSGVQRLWSSDEPHTSFSLPRTHRHASWAFTAAGVYRLEVTARAAIDGVPVADSATYTFVVGDLPEVVETATSLEVSDTTIVEGDSVVLAASVTPTTADGHVEFREGGTVLGHEQVAGGKAELVVDDLGVGTRSVTASFVPTSTRAAQASTSSPVQITVTDPSGVPFGIDGVRAAYQPGDLLAARVVGHSLAEGESYRWLIRPIGATNSYAFSGTGPDAAAGRVEQLLDPSYDAYEISVRLRRGNTNAAQTEWVPLRVADAVEPVPGSFQAAPAYVGDDIAITVQSRPLAATESLRVVQRWADSPWSDASAFTEQVDEDTFAVQPEFGMTGVQWAVQVVRDGLVVAQSDPFSGDVHQREALVEGIRGVYRVGQTLRATATVHPAREGLVYRWFTFDVETFEFTTLQEGTDASALTLELPMTMELHDLPLYFSAEWDYGRHVATAASSSTVLKVSDSDPSTQLFFFESLSGHYHQGGPVNLRLVADPELAEGDTIAWSWRWPGSESWSTLPGASGMSHAMLAEQALDGVQLRADLTFGPDGERLTTEPMTIHVDDHGAPARQVLTVGGAGQVAEGDPVTLTADLASPSVLDTYRWQRRAGGEAEFRTLPGETGPRLAFAASLDDHGAEYRVALVKPTGETAYGPSAAVGLRVARRPVVANDALPEVAGVPVVGEVLSASAGAWTPAPDGVAYQWLVDGEPVASGTGPRLHLTEAHLGATVSVRVTAARRDHLSGVVTSAATGPVSAAPSSVTPPVTQPETPPAAATVVSVPAVRQVYGRAAEVVVAVSGGASGSVVLSTGGRTVTGPVVDGTARVRLPARWVAPGRHVLMASYAGEPGRSQPSVARTSLAVAKAAPSVRLSWRDGPPAAGRTLLRVRVDADGATPTGRVTVRTAGRSHTVRLDDDGRARVVLVVPRRTAGSADRVVVAYGGDRYVAPRRWSRPIPDEGRRRVR